MPSRNYYSRVILVVDDEYQVAHEIQAALNQLGYTNVHMAFNSEDARLMANQYRPAIILMDIKMSGPLNGVNTANLIRTDYGIRSIFVTGYSKDKDVLRSAQGSSPYEVLGKPVDPARLSEVLEIAFSSPEIHASTIAGTVVKNEDSMIIVRFDLDGVEELRAFPWDDLLVPPTEVPVGTEVIGRTKLERILVQELGADDGFLTRKISDKFAVGADRSRVGTSYSDSHRESAQEEWHRIIKAKSKFKPPEDTNEG